MDFRDLVQAQHARCHSAEVAGADLSLQDLFLRDMPAERLRARPHPSFNSPAWLLWHMTRAEDIAVAIVLAERKQVLDEGDWAQRMNAGRRDIGSGMTADEVDALTDGIDVAALLGYRIVVGGRTQDVIRGMHPELLDEDISPEQIERARTEGAFGPNAEWVPQRWAGKRKGFTLTHTVIGHSFLHLGEGAVLRSLMGLPTL